MNKLKFLEGTENGYKNLAVINQHTFYKTENNLYLGSMKLTGGSDFSGSYNDLTDKPTIPPKLGFSNIYPKYPTQDTIIYCSSIGSAHGRYFIEEFDVDNYLENNYSITEDYQHEPGLITAKISTGITPWSLDGSSILNPFHIINFGHSEIGAQIIINHENSELHLRTGSNSNNIIKWENWKKILTEDDLENISGGGSSLTGETTETSTALGYNCINEGNNSIAIGLQAGTNGNNAMAIGMSNPLAYGDSSIAIGNSATACLNNGSLNGNNFGSIAIGQQATADRSYSIAIGYNAKVNYNSGICIGNGISTGVNSIAIGANAQASGEGAISILGKANNVFTISIGGNAPTVNSIAIGKNSACTGANSIAIGANAFSGVIASVSIGHNSHAGGMGIAIGSTANATTSSIAIGASSNVVAANSTAIGVLSHCSNTNSIQLGDNANLSSITAKVAITVVSDERDKINIKPIDYGAINFLKEIEPITYLSNQRILYIDNENLSEEDEENKSKYGICNYDREAHISGTKKGSRQRVGVKAQQVQEALESVFGSSSYANLVNDNLFDYDKNEIPEGIESQLSVNYEGFIPFLIKGIQELTTRIEFLERKMSNE